MGLEEDPKCDATIVADAAVQPNTRGYIEMGILLVAEANAFESFVQSCNLLAAFCWTPDACLHSVIGWLLRRRFIDFGDGKHGSETSDSFSFPHLAFGAIVTSKFEDSLCGPPGILDEHIESRIETTSFRRPCNGYS